MKKRLEKEILVEEILSEEEIQEIKDMQEDLWIDWTIRGCTTLEIAGDFGINHKNLVHYISRLIKMDKRYSHIFFPNSNRTEYYMEHTGFITLLHTYLGQEHHEKKMRYLALIQTYYFLNQEWPVELTN